MKSDARHDVSRRCLLIGSLPIAAHANARSQLERGGKATPELKSLAALCVTLGMNTESIRQLAHKVFAAVPLEDQHRHVAAAANRLFEHIGAVTASAKASMPALIDDDYEHGRFVLVHGVSFSHTELALMFPLTDGAREVGADA